MKTIEHFEKIKEEAQQWIEELKNKNQIDFSRFIWRHWNVLAIKWDKLLKSIGNWDINYDNINKNDYNKLVTFREAILSDLKKGDIFILK